MEKKKREARTARFSVNLAPSLVTQLDDYADDHRWTRAVAIEVLLEQALAAATTGRRNREMITVRLAYSIRVLCACRDEETGKPLGQACPQLWRKDGRTWNNSHGSAGWAARVPTSAGVKQVKRYGYESKAGSRKDAEHAPRCWPWPPTT